MPTNNKGERYLKGACVEARLHQALRTLRDGASRHTSKEFGISARSLRRHRDSKVKTPGKFNLGRFDDDIRPPSELLLVLKT